jgi:DNA polymerase
VEARGPTPAGVVEEVALHLRALRTSAGRWLPASTPAPAPEPPSAVAAARPAGTGRADLEVLAAQVATCTRCALGHQRRHAVFGEGSLTPRLVVVGEAPGAEEDATGRPFVGAAGKLLTRMLAAIGLTRDEVYICNLLKCRPPGNRDPRPDEVASCKPYLRAQIERLAPELILALGSPATRELLRTERGITSLRGRIARSPEGWRVLPSYHPAYLLRNPAAKREAWEDLQRVARELGLEIPSKADREGD